MLHRLAAAVIAALALVACGPGPGDLTPMSIAARRGDAREIARLSAAGHDVNRPDPGLNHWSPLLHAVHKAQPASVEALIAAGADLNRSGPEGVTPLIMAAGNGRADIVRRLLAAGADPHVAADDLLEVAVAGGALTDIEQPLLGRCNTEVVSVLLKTAPDLRLRRPLRGRLALLFARLNHCDQVIRMLKTS